MNLVPLALSMVYRVRAGALAVLMVTTRLGETGSVPRVVVVGPQEPMGPRGRHVRHV